MALRIRPLTVTDVALGMHLKAQAGWNQTEDDWHRFLAMEPDGCFLAEVDERPAGTVCTCVFGGVAWIAMVLVEEKLRGQGIGTALMKHALAWLDGRRVRTIRLDATPLGRPVYEKLGFVAEYELHRYEGTPRALAAKSQLDPIPAEQLDEVMAFDRESTGTDRAKMLTRLYAEWPEATRIARGHDAVHGFIMARRGARALFLGPCLAQPDVGPNLFADAWQRFAGQPLFLDIPVANKPAIALAEAQGLRVQRSLLRMCRGPVIPERRDWIWASSGPEKG